MKTVFIPHVEEGVFLSIFSPYKRWDEWKKSKFCFLTRKEVVVVDFYNHYFSSGKPDREEDQDITWNPGAYKLATDKAMEKLSLYFEYYERWCS